MLVSNLLKFLRYLKRFSRYKQTKFTYFTVRKKRNFFASKPDVFLQKKIRTPAL